jgi:large repetitive protein
MSDTFIDAFAVPGSNATLTFERDASGRLVRLSAGTRVYFAEEESGERTYGEGLGSVREVALKNGIVRHVRAAGQSWIEEYLWDEIGRPLRIDGVEIERDEKRRVVACGNWRYAYAGEDLAVITSPGGMRHVTRGVDGRPVSVRNGHGAIPIRYHDDGARSDVAPLPPTWHRDSLGRLWTICDAKGNVETTFLWNGFSCIGRIDGDAGAPLAAFFSLDPSSTPVRVITADGVMRIPRDAFGESLLAHDRVPGLYGGAVHGGFVHLRSRALDPRSGSFDRRDPWHGRDDDPRRARGFEGPLPVEDPKCGPYAVCQYDPVGRTDPTGEASKGFKVGMGFLYAILDATWSLQHNTAGLLALDWTIAFWFSVIFGIGQAIGGSDERNQLSNFFDYEGMYNDRTGVWAIRRGIFGLERGFVYQHLLTVPAERFDALNASSVIVPVTKFEPSLYGTLLHVAPADFPPMLLRGNHDAAVAGWSRSGGPAEPIAPGSPTPRFPLGGLHFDTPRDDIRGPLTCDVTELVPAGTPLLGTIDEPRIATTIPFSRDLKAGQIVLLSDATTALDIKTIAEVDDKHATRKRGRRVRFTEPALHVAANGVRLRGLGESEGTDAGRKSPAPKHIDIAEGTVKYKKEHLLRFKQGGNVVGAGIIDGFEAQIVLDSGVPNDFTLPLELRVVVAAGKTTKGKLDGIKLKAKPRPSKEDAIVVISGDQKVAAIVTKELGDDEVELDRTAAELAPLGADVSWKPLSRGTKLGQAASLPAGATLSYTPETLRQAPKTGMILLREDKRPHRSVVRSVTSRNYDALVLVGDLPGNAADPYDIEIFPIKRPKIENLTLQLDPRIKLAGPQPVNAQALQIFQHATPAVEAGPIKLAADFAGKEATMASVLGLEPSQYVVLTGTGGGPQPNVITQITAAIAIDRQLAFTATDPIDVLPIAPAGPVYDAEAIDATQVVVHATSGGNALQFPRFEKGAIVEAVFGGNTELYIVDAVNGSMLTLKEGPAGAAIAAAAKGTIQLVVPVAPAPANDTWRIGMSGKPDGAGATTNKITADIWNDIHVRNGSLIALVQKNVTHAAKINAAPTFAVQLLAASTVGNKGDVTIPALSPSTTAVFTQDKEFLTLADVTGPALVKGPNAMVVIPYGASAIAQTKMPMTSGTVRVPVDAEKYEIDRRKSLVYHELTHTKQAQQLGPWWIALFPLFALEGLFEGTTDIELPKFSKYVAATITIENGNSFLAIPNTEGIDFATGKKVQVEQNGAHLVTLGAKNGDRFLINGGGELVAGAVQVRRMTDEGGWGTARDVVFNILSALTLGGVTNYVTGTVWGGFLFGIFKFIHFLGHRLGKAGDELPAVVVDSRTVRMTSDEGRREIQGYDRVFLLKGGDRSDLLDVESIINDTITLKGTTSFTGNISVNPYSSDDPLSTTVVDSLTYFNATVPDPTKPAQIRVEKNGDDELKLKQFDRVSINAGATSTRTNVTAVNGDGTVELEDVPLTFGPDRALRVAFIDANDPIDSVDGHFLLTRVGMGWMRTLADPWRQIQYGLDPKPGSAADWLARFARYSFSSHSWSAVIPGYVFLDNIFKQMKNKDAQHPSGNGHLSRTEQQACDESGGSIYSPQAKIRGGFTDDGHAKKKAKVGDIARYWHTPSWEHEQPLIEGSHLDSPGLSLPADTIEVLPEAGPESAGGTINKGAVSKAARPGTSVPDAFYAKRNAADPESATGLLGGLLPAARGFIPPTPQLELSLGHYVAFTKPGTHRVTVRDTIPNAILAREAHDAGRQTIFFDVTVSDVTVKIANTVIARKEPPDEIKLNMGQRASLTVDSAGEWMLTAERPGNVVRIGTDGTSLKMAAGAPGTSETLEVSRVYPVVNGDTYAEEVLAAHGVNLPVPIHVPVRQFKVTLSDQFDLVGELKEDARPVASAKAGQTLFALLPARIPPGETLTAAFAFPGTAAPNPKVIITPIPTPADLTAFIGPGRIFKIEFPVDEPPEEPVTITFTIKLGEGAGVPISAKLDYQPHFRLTAASFDIAQKANTDLASAEEIGSAFVADGLPGVKTVLAQNGKNINVRVVTRAPEGARRIMAVSKADRLKRALRTIKVPVLPAAVTFDATFQNLVTFVELGLSFGDDLDTSSGAFEEKKPPTRLISRLTGLTHVERETSGALVLFRYGDKLFDPAAFAPAKPVVQKNSADPTLFDLRLTGRICYPSDPANPGKVAGPAPVPVVAILHGNHDALFASSASGVITTTSVTLASGATATLPVKDVVKISEVGNHLGYEYLQKELARNGIASISVDTNVANFKDCMIQSRADMLLATLDEWRKQAQASPDFKDKFDFQNRVGLMGHSRGGDAVVRAALDNHTRTPRDPNAPQTNDRYGITAVCSLAPTDFTGIYSNAMELKRDHQVSYLVVYGSLDTDVAGWAQGSAGPFAAETGTGFRLYDRASCDKAMIFVKGACHNRFNTNWGTEGNVSAGDLDGDLFVETKHLEVSELYIGGFFRWLFTGEATFEDLFTGVTPPPAGVTTSIQYSFGDEVRRVDTFENAGTNELGEIRAVEPYAKVLPFGDVKVNGIAEGTNVAHQTKILDADLTGAVPKATVLIEPVPLADWSGSRFLTFRIGRWFDLAAKPFAGAQPHVTVRVEDNKGGKATVAETDFYTADVPGKPFRHEFPAGGERLTFHRLDTVRIPLSLFKGVDLHFVQRVSFDLDEKDKVHVFIDSVEAVRF